MNTPTTRLLILTQVMDRRDPSLSFFHRWVEELAPRFAHIEVVCLFEGEHDLPPNVRVHSLGKETGPSRIKYVTRFYRYLWNLRAEYDAVFVHMNQEYAILGGPLWRLMGKRLYLWRNYHSGDLGTDIAAFWADRVFCTSKHSYTAKYRKTMLMPVGVDTSRFLPDARIPRESRSILFLARIAPSKRQNVFIEALGHLIQKGTSFIASIYGSALPEDERYYESLKQRVEELGLHGRVRFHPGVANADTPQAYRTHEISVNCSPSGMFDKTLFEGAASGTLTLASSKDFAEEVDERLSFPDGDAAALAARLTLLLSLEPAQKDVLIAELAAAADRHSLAALAERLAQAIH
jgi:glycosyltransferase involved in cell wall biosynthesis